MARLNMVLVILAMHFAFTAQEADADPSSDDQEGSNALIQESQDTKNCRQVFEELVRQGCIDFGRSPPPGVNYTPSATLCISTPSTEWIQTLQQLAGLRRLDSLVISPGDWSPAGKIFGDDYIAAAGQLPGLRCLSLYRTEANDQSLKLIAGLKEIERLYLARTRITDAGLKELAVFKELRCLDLSHTKVGVDPAAFKALANVERLELTSCVLSADVVDAIGSSPRLRWLILNDCRIEEGRLSGLCAAGNLEEVCLARTNISSDSLKFMESCPKLQRVNIVGCRQVSDTAVPYFLACKRKMGVALLGTRISDSGVRRLLNAEPPVGVVR